MKLTKKKNLRTRAGLTHLAILGMFGSTDDTVFPYVLLARLLELETEPPVLYK
jgi:hypothetical protein